MRVVSSLPVFILVSMQDPIVFLLQFDGVTEVPASAFDYANLPCRPRCWVWWQGEPQCLHGERGGPGPGRIKSSHTYRSHVSQKPFFWYGIPWDASGFQNNMCRVFGLNFSDLTTPNVNTIQFPKHMLPPLACLSYPGHVFRLLHFLPTLLGYVNS